MWVPTVGANHPPPLEGAFGANAVFHEIVGDGEDDWVEIPAPARLTPEEPLPEELRIYTDGSLTTTPWPGGARAGWGIAVFRGSKQVLKGFGPIHAPQGQTAPEAELGAARVCSKLWHPGLARPRCDCKQVVDLLNRPPRSALMHGSVHAGHAQAVIAGFGGQMPTTKVKAHREEREAQDESDRIDILGNAAADAAAKAGASVHPRPSSIEMQEASNEWSFLVGLAAAAAKLSSFWPSLRHRLGGRLIRIPCTGRSRPPQRRPLIPLDRRHHFEQFGEHILCSACLCRCRTWEGARRREEEEACNGVAQPLQEALDSRARGHTLALGIFDGRATFICLRCGSHSTAKVAGLGRRCGDRPPTHGPACLRRFFRGVHPDYKNGTTRGEAWFRVLRSGEMEEFTPSG